MIDAFSGGTPLPLRTPSTNICASSGVTCSFGDGDVSSDMVCWNGEVDLEIGCEDVGLKEMYIAV